ncbi:MAG: hypothetical protein GF350_06400 [Chitinivibrionales bacterium]|nr:hypothetical protein [Chitinivibrionales bacterium]
MIMIINNHPNPPMDDTVSRTTKLIDNPVRDGLADYLRNPYHRGRIYVNRKKKLIAMKVPKVAGSSILKGAMQDELGPFMYSDHMSDLYAWWLQYLTDEDLKDYFIFSFVRNPWDRFMSLCAYFGNRYPFIESPLDAAERWYDYLLVINFKQHATPQHPHTHMRGARFANYIGRFENLQEDYNTLCALTGIRAATLPHYRKTEHKHYSEMDKRVRDFVAKTYEKDITLYGYTYD